MVIYRVMSQHKYTMHITKLPSCQDDDCMMAVKWHNVGYAYMSSNNIMYHTKDIQGYNVYIIVAMLQS